MKTKQQKIEECKKLNKEFCDVLRQELLLERKEKMRKSKTE